MKKYTGRIMSLAVSLALIATGCSNTPAANSEAVPPLVKVISVGAMQQGGLMATGKVNVSEEIQVVSKLAGKVAKVSVKEGDVVREGDALIQLEADDYLQQVKQAEAGIQSAQARLADAQSGARSQELQRLQSGVEQAKAALEVAQHSYDRMKALHDSGAISSAEFEKATLEKERARTAYDQAKAQLELAQAGPTSHSLAALQAEVSRLQSSLQLAQNTLANTTLKAPISGIIARRSIDPGEMAQPGVPLLTIVQMDDVKVEASVPQDQINQLKAGMEVLVRIPSLQGKAFTGTVEFVSPVSDVNSSTFPIKIRVTNADGQLRAGMLAEVLKADAASSGLQLPASAVVQKDGKAYVYTVNGETVHLTAVTVSETKDGWVTVTGGLSAQDQVVAQPAGNLSDGSKVRVN